MPDPQAVETTERFRALLEESLTQIERTVSWVATRLCLTGDDADEFRSWVHEKLVEDDYRVLRGFQGRSTLATYLVAVIQNLARDYRMKTWSRWRPSAAAERLGLVALQLETLRERDGFTLDEAAEILRSNHGVRMSGPELADLAAKLPARTPVRFEGDAGVATAVSEERADRGVRESERRATLANSKEALAGALAELDVLDRLVLRMYYRSGLTIAAIAAALNLEQRPLYNRRDRCLRTLKADLEDRGLNAAEVLDAVAWLDADFKVDFGLREAKDADNEPSNQVETKAEDEP